MTIPIQFYSYFKELTGCEHATETLPPGSTIGELLDRLMARFPSLAPMRKSMLIAVGMEYQDRHYVLKESDEVALFPPVQGG
jgi:molybdopterin converting factor small subunit